MRRGRDSKPGVNERACRAFALLWVLGLLVLIVPLLALSAQAAMRMHVAVRTDEDVQTAHDLFVASEEPILAWLQAEADHGVLPLDEGGMTGGSRLTPLVLDDSWTTSHGIDRQSGPDGTLRADALHIRIIAFDQCAMVPFPLSDRQTGLMDRELHALQELLPVSTQPFIDQMEAKRHQGTPGLDWFMANVAESTLNQVLNPSAIFPTAISNEIIEHTRQQDGTTQRFVEVSGALGAYISPRVVPEIPATVNVNMAPQALLNALFASWGRSGLEQIIEKRASGELVTVVPPASDSDAGAQDQIHLVTSSHMWAFRIDVSVNIVERSWWSIYARQVDSSSNPWKCVQRLVITQ